MADAEIMGIGSFDVVIAGISEQDALKAIQASVTPKVRAAFQTALDEAKAAHANASLFSFRFGEDGTLNVYLRKENRLLCKIRRYPGKGGVFYQAWIPAPVAKDVRSANIETVKQRVIKLWCECEEPE